MIANLCLLLAPALAPSATIQEPQPAPPPQQPPAPAQEEAKPVQQETPPPPKPEPEPKPEPKPKEEPRPEPPAVFRSANSSPLGYTYWQFDVVRGDGDGYLDGPDGFDVHGSYALAQPGLFLFGGFSHLSGSVGFSSPDTNNLTVGAGMHTPINPLTDVVFEVSAMHANAESQSPSSAFNGWGYGVGAGLRHMATESLEVNGGMRFTEFDDSDSEFTLHAGLVYRASPVIGLCTDVTTSDDLDTLTLGIRYTP